MKRLNLKLINMLERKNIIFSMRQALINYPNLFLYTVFGLVIAYVIYCVVIIKSNYDTSLLFSSDDTVLKTSRGLHAILAVFLSNTVLYYNRNILVSERVKNYIYIFSKWKNLDTIKFAYLPILKILLVTLILISLPSYLSLMFYEIGKIEIVVDFIILLLLIVYIFLFALFISLILIRKRFSSYLVVFTMLLTALINAVIVYFVTQSNLYFLYVLGLTATILLFGYIYIFSKTSNLYFTNSQIYSGNFLRKKQFCSNQFKFHASKYIRYLQFELKRQRAEGEIKDYLYTFITLVVGFLICRLTIPESFNQVLIYLLGSFGINELNMILSTNLVLFLFTNTRLLRREGFHLLGYFFGNLSIIFFFDLIVTILFHILMGQFNFGLRIVLDVLFVVAASTIFTKIFMTLFDKKTFILLLNLVAISLIQTLIIFILSGNQLLINTVTLILSFLGIVILIYKLRENRLC